eukprot:3824442-Pyramimonas_sp.AAC.2
MQLLTTVLYCTVLPVNKCVLRCDVLCCVVLDRLLPISFTYHSSDARGLFFRVGAVGAGDVGGGGERAGAWRDNPRGRLRAGGQGPQRAAAGGPAAVRHSRGEAGRGGCNIPNQ